MPSYQSIWVTALVVLNVIGVSLWIYAIDHLTGAFSSSFKRAPAKQADDDPDDFGPEIKKKKRKKGATEAEQNVAIDVHDFSLYPVELSWEDIHYKVYTGDATAIKHLIHKCSGSFLPSEFVAIMGPSGAGKSTMLDVLAGRKSPKGLEGRVTLNDQLISPRLANRFLSYVGQEDVFLPTLSVIESLEFVVNLAMKPLPRVQKVERMNNVLETLGLLRVKNSKVGGLLPGGLEVRGLSGGEKRRLSIACGLISNPSIIFLDEPTTGLDSHAALAVMKYLHSLTVLGHTIVSTIHQPRQEIFKSFDKLLIMSEGHQLFLAPPSFVVPWFTEVLGLPYNKEQDGTVADWLLGAVAVNFHTEATTKSTIGSVQQVQAAAEKFREMSSQMQSVNSFNSDADGVNGEKNGEEDSHSSSSGPENGKHSPEGLTMRKLDSRMEEPPTLNNWADDPNIRRSIELQTRGSNRSGRSQEDLYGDQISSSPRDEMRRTRSGKIVGTLANTFGNKDMYVRSWWVQFVALWKRFVMQQLRNPVEAAMRFVAAGVCGVFFGLIWIRLSPSPDSAQVRLSLLFFITMVICMTPFGFMAFPAADKRFFALDVTRGLYSPSAYFMAYVCSNAPFYILQNFGMTTIIYGLAGLRYQAWAVFQLGSIVALHSLIANQFITWCIWATSSQDTGFSLATIYISFSLLICGFYIRISDMKLSIMKGLSWTSFSKYTFQALSRTELFNRNWDYSLCFSNDQPVTPEGFDDNGSSLCTLVQKEYNQTRGYTLPSNSPRMDPGQILLIDYFGFRLTVADSTAAMLGFYVVVCLLSYWALKRIAKKK